VQLLAVLPDVSSQSEPQSLSLITLIIADKSQTTITALTTICLSLRYNAACGIPLRHLRENNTQEYSINLQTKKPQSLSQITLIIADKPQNNNNPQPH
jgi:hypothetical protein